MLRATRSSTVSSHPPRKGTIADAGLWLLAACLFAGCSFIDDFGKFRIADKATNRDAGALDAATTTDARVPPGVDANQAIPDARTPTAPQPDAAAPDAQTTGCKDSDCKALDSECTRGECKAGSCVATPIHDGDACGGSKCRICNAGKCGDPNDCSSLDSDCAHGMCDDASGKCVSMILNEGKACFDDNPCTYAEQCKQGICAGTARDCSTYDDECSQGICDPETGGCAFGPNRMSQPCDDAKPCTLNDRCDASGFCVSDTDAAPGATCTDYNECTGIAGAPDACDGSGNCLAGGSQPTGATCNDDNECTLNDACDGSGECTGAPTRQGQPCNVACSGNTVCNDGYCEASTGTVAFDSKCFLHWCGIASLCQDDWKKDRVCDCGCPFSDPDCNACSPRMCESDPGRGHRAISWCDQGGNAVGNCPDSLKGDGRCDCGCQFADPDCGGGACCGATGKAGCDNKFVENCLCRHESNPKPSCCSSAWTQDCADVAEALGCMICP